MQLPRVEMLQLLNISLQEDPLEELRRVVLLVERAEPPAPKRRRPDPGRVSI